MPAKIRHRLTPQQRNLLLGQVIRDGANISIACKKFQVSRTTFYRWCKKYTSSAASNQTRKKTFLYTSSVYRKLENSIRKLILASDPILSKYTLHKIFQENHPDIRIGIHGFYKIRVYLCVYLDDFPEISCEAYIYLILDRWRVLTFVLNSLIFYIRMRYTEKSSFSSGYLPQMMCIFYTTDKKWFC